MKLMFEINQMNVWKKGFLTISFVIFEVVPSISKELRISNRLSLMLATINHQCSNLHTGIMTWGIDLKNVLNWTMMGKNKKLETWSMLTMLNLLMEKPITRLERYELYAETSNVCVQSLSCHVNRKGCVRRKGAVKIVN